MIHEKFDIPDGDEETICKAERFLREAIEELGGEIIKKLEAHGFGECPGFDAVFYLPEPEGDETDEGDMDLIRDYAKLYHELDDLHALYAETFAEWL